jgi:hypothetical protein
VLTGSKYEVVDVDGAEITVDVSMLAKNVLQCNDMARPFGKVLRDFLRLESTREYM